MADPSRSSNKSSKRSMGEMGRGPSLVEPGINPGTPGNVVDLPADVKRQLHKETEAQKKIRREDYKKMLDTRFVGYKVQDNPEWKREAARAEDIRLSLSNRAPALSGKAFNDGLRFHTPRSQTQLEHTISDFYERNTNLQILDGQELPNEMDIEG
jgi:hypothetical protein